MGYTTEFEGQFEIDREIEPWLEEYINNFSESRHITRDVDEYKKSHPDWASKCFKGNPGTDGEYIADNEPLMRNPFDAPDIKDYNMPPGDCPGLWCQWVIKGGKYIEWNEAEKFYKYSDWLAYIIDNFLAPEGYVVNGQVEYQGEDKSDRGVIIVTDNEVVVIPD